MSLDRSPRRRRARPALVAVLTGIVLTIASACSTGSAPRATPGDDGCVTGEIAPAALQGTGATSPLLGQRVSIDGVVMGDFQGDDDAAGDLGGFFVQGAPDGDPASSDAVFVYAPGADTVAPGDRVQVHGTVQEEFSQTQVGAVSAVTRCARGELPDPTALALPVDPPAGFEALEGMRVRIGGLAVAETRGLDDFGEIVLSAGGPLTAPTQAAAPGPPAQAVATANANRQIVLDDGRSGTQQRPVRFLAPGQTLRSGDTLDELTGVLSFAFDRWRIQPTEPVTFSPANRRTGSPADVGGDVRVASFNVLNYFTSLEGGRGATNPEDFAEQQGKLVAAIERLGADVVALQEIESNDGAATQALVDALNDARGGQRWARTPVPGNFTGTDAITVAQIYRSDRAQRAGEPVALADPAFLNARQPIAQTYTIGGETVTVIANHFKSKSCGQAAGENADRGDGAGCWNLDRTAQARALAAFVTDRRAAIGDGDVLILGDLNSYAREEPVAVLTGAGLVDQLTRHVPDPQRYTYVFDGARGVLDHALATPELSAKITGAAVWHINADEPDLLEYTGDPAYTTLDPYRSSDHDPVLIGIGP
jgi:predicted extracellular nuclease